MSLPPVDVMVPMRDYHVLTRSLCRQLAEQGEFDRLWVYDNGSSSRSSRNWLSTIETTGRYGAEVVRWGPAKGIYRMWNDAWRRSLHTWRAETAGDPAERRFLAILNNDLEIPPRFLSNLAAGLLAGADEGVWATFPQWGLSWPSESTPTGRLSATRGTRNAGGMSGYAFLLDVTRHDTDGLPFIDEEFIWYSGDGDLVTQIEINGGTAARVEGLPVGHKEKATSRHHPWAKQQGPIDMRRYRRKYPNREDVCPIPRGPLSSTFEPR